ncbi:MAG: hypothetical protein ABIK92_18575 [Pseudomonadota bacterium]
MQEEINNLISNNIQQKKEHSVDVHFTLPLLFKRLYFVFSAGPDVRAKKINTSVLDMEKRSKTKAKDTLIVIMGFLFFSAFFGALLIKIMHIMANRTI